MSTMDRMKISFIEEEQSCSIININLNFKNEKINFEGPRIGH